MSLKIIDADEMMALLKKHHFRGIKEMVAEAPEILRCKDCKHLMFSDFYGECRKGCLRIVKPDDYCSFAERKDDENCNRFNRA